MGLTAKQESFCVNYILTKNGTQSAIKAGYSSNYNVAHVIAAENLQKPTIQARLNELLASVLPDNEVAEVAKAVVKERFEILSEVARHKIEAPVTAGHKIAAVAEMNKMEGSYAPEKHAVLGDIVIRVVFKNKLEGGRNGI